jgi:predicted MarR family transcription regulator
MAAPAGCSRGWARSCFLGSVSRECRHSRHATGEGQALCQRYDEICEQVRVSGLAGSGTEGFELSVLARFLRVLSGLYEQAARAATSL